MRAGLLRERAAFFVEKGTRTPSGAMKKELRFVCSARCYRKKRTDHDVVTGSEEFNAGRVELQLRDGEHLEGVTHFEYDGARYKINQALREVRDHTVVFTGVKVNE